ncbi:MAG: DUF4349 domain-containing protein [Chloroflexota bacterium]|nr:DUF4349 domain-containing protein [Chloroflexota bacterium]
MLLVGGCAGGSDDSDAAGGSDAPRAAADSGGNRDALEAPKPSDFGQMEAEIEALSGDLDDSAMSTGSDGLRAAASDLEAPAENAAGPAESLREPAIISKASVSMESDDVQQARFDAIEVMDKYHGSLQADESSTGEDGAMKTARIAIRVPSKDFEAAYADLQTIGENVSARSGSEDVTTEVIDVEARIRAQEQSLARMEALLGQAQSLRTVIAIESQLTRRQAELDSLKSRQAFLQDQTSDATIIVHIERTPEKEEPKEEDEDDKGFLAGLSDGWDNLAAATVGLATVLGLLLPFLVVIALVGVPIAVLVRRWRPAPAPVTEPAD